MEYVTKFGEKVRVLRNVKGRKYLHLTSGDIKRMKHTQKAFLVNGVWYPKSQSFTKDMGDGTVSVYVAEWLYGKKEVERRAIKVKKAKEEYDQNKEFTPRKSSGGGMVTLKPAMQKEKHKERLARIKKKYDGEKKTFQSWKKKFASEID